MSITVSSSAFAAGARIPKPFTGDGEDVSPPLHWDGLPAGTQELALICDDPDAPTAEPWVHWVIRLYALDCELNLNPSCDKNTLLRVMDGHVLAQGELVGTYQR